MPIRPDPHSKLPPYDVTPVADPANIITGPGYRITVLDPGLVRLEYSATGEFEDRASQMVLNRAFPRVDYELVESEDLLEVHTERLHLIYNKQAFSTSGLSVQATGGVHSSASVWRYGRPAGGNLGGTARTLDEVDGSCRLDPGILSRDGIAVVDDSATVLLSDDGWIAPRRAGNEDLYVFAFGRDYQRALQVFHQLTGPVPLLPRYVLGNWWSRYHPYSAQEYVDLMDRFAAHSVPLAVAVLDMDWHLVEIDPKYGSGWTGYTWNTELFPDPPAFLRELHDRRLAVSLNVHPAEGVHAHERAYAAMAKRMGIDPVSELPVRFDLTDPEFLRAYLEELHHPLEDEGVDFWWLDWQQGSVTRLPGLDPLWLLNHAHFLDSGRRGRRPITFSRYAGVGSHRYPVGFSGDTVASWASLDFQPYFTATASNVGFGWWSHDIGGHFGGSKDDELVTRWVQLGVFSPITRLHSSLSPFNSKEPWRFGEQAERIITRFLRLRHQLVPYLYTMNRRAHVDGEPLVQPMYHLYPQHEAAYTVPNQYFFGDQLLVAPITTPRDPETLVGAVRAWLPPGRWIDVFTGDSYRGDCTIGLHRDLETIPVLARAGAIVPMVPADDVMSGTANPATLELRVYAGADGEVTIAEDDDDERWAFTTVRYVAGVLHIDPVEGDLSSVPRHRRYQVVLCGFDDVDGEPGPVPGSVRITVEDVDATEGARIAVGGRASVHRPADFRDRAFRLLDRAQIPYLLKEQAYGALDLDRPGGLERVIAELTALELPQTLHGALVELLVANR